ncbi:MAG: nucleotidyltransferase family protein [Syntrophomonadaceae bacterium]|nr:nucleotidyltransferase family protein [Syntrophomonadaceae bacterium]MDD3271335.1 nucleotidyltransferase family protein [Syntrophomonadaceae bacterium]MDD3897940.1 nucleotidyltransferase family protein [Syntrophomonadaceae bacterium]MDD4563131.1 nucleotidyltransferase family protein [Syntrophomonadaceae bacterium]
MQYDAIILAGGESSGELKKIAPYDNEALIMIGNYPMIYYVYQALRQSPAIRNIVISGPTEALRNIFIGQDRLFFVSGGQNAIESFAHGVELLREKGISEQILIMPSDIPFITIDAINDFINQAEQYDAEFYYPVTRKEVNEARFPGVSRTYVKLRDGIFTGGNLFILRSELFDQVLEIALKLVERRKNPLAMAKLFGFGLVWKYIIRRLNINAVEKRFYQTLGIKGKAIISPYAEVGVDVDKPSDLELAQKHLEGFRF